MLNTTATTRPETLNELTDLMNYNFGSVTKAVNSICKQKNSMGKDIHWLAEKVGKQEKTIKKLKTKIGILTVLGIAYVIFNETRMTQVRIDKVDDEKEKLEREHILEMLDDHEDRITCIEIFSSKGKNNDKEG